jgi:hypothetical protein
VTFHEVKSHLHISNDSTHWIIQDHFVLHEVCARWDPKQITGDHKRNRLIIYEGLLNRYRTEWDSLSFGQMSLHHYAPEIKRLNMGWELPTLSFKKFRNSIIGEKSDVDTVFGKYKD